MKRAIVSFTPEFLMDKLQLPEGTTIIGAAWDVRTWTVELVVSHESIPDTLPEHHAYRVRLRQVSEWV